jgi:hypothetical protein
MTSHDDGGEKSGLAWHEIGRFRWRVTRDDDGWAKMPSHVNDRLLRTTGLQFRPYSVVHGNFLYSLPTTHLNCVIPNQYFQGRFDVPFASRAGHGVRDREQRPYNLGHWPSSLFVVPDFNSVA